MAARILIVDDDPQFRALARTLLQRSGYEVVAEAADAAQARALVDSSNPDAALIDVQLPDVDGVSLCHKLAEHEGGLRIVLTSTDPTLVPPAILAASGAIAFVSKENIAVADLASWLDR